MAKRPLPDQATLLKLLRYEPDTGKLFWRERSLADGFKTVRSWRTWSARYTDQEAFTCDNGLGYRDGSVFGTQYKAHRIIWKMVTGEDADDIDHINGKRSDNRWLNLRSVSRLENTRNAAVYSTNTSGHIGVSERGGRWIARIRVRGCRVWLGIFDRKDDAVRARLVAEREHGFHPNHGRPQ